MSNALGPAETADLFNQAATGWNGVVGLRFLQVSGDEVAAELLIGEQHLQPYGVVHGGVYCSMIETVCSVGAGFHGMSSGLGVVGIENHTSFLHAVRSGKVRAVARPLTRGRRSQLWEASVFDARDRILATGRVRLLCIESGSMLAGETLKTPASGG
jgi:uncharacterized protein (TIGR00369 family)